MSDIFKIVISYMNYEDYAVFFKALSDENRLKIMDMLSCGEI